MEAHEEVQRLIRKIQDGSLHPNEPIFVIRARDISAHHHVTNWVEQARHDGASGEKLHEANGIAKQMMAWPIKQVPGRPDTVRDDPLGLAEETICPNCGGAIALRPDKSICDCVHA